MINQMDVKLKELTYMLYTRFCTIYGDKFAKDYHSDDFIKIWVEDWSEGLSFIDHDHIKSAITHCKLKREWPPSLPEFISLCEKASGMPSFEESFKSAIREDFSHPVTKLAYNAIGSWDMKRDTQEVLLKKFKVAYEDAVSIIRTRRNAGITKFEELETPINVVAIK